MLIRNPHAPFHAVSPTTHCGKSVQPNSQSGGFPCAYPLAGFVRFRPVMRSQKPQPFLASVQSASVCLATGSAPPHSGTTTCSVPTKREQSGSNGSGTCLMLPPFERLFSVPTPKPEQRGPHMPYPSSAAILPATPSQAADYLRVFANRRAYLRQSQFPNKETGRFYYYKECDRKSNEPVGIDLTTIRSHLAGRLTIGLYAINPQSQTSKWFAVDADYQEARKDLLRIQQEFLYDGIDALMEQSRRGGHLWTFMAEPLPAKLCRLYVLNVARRLGIAVKRDRSDGIEVFPRQDELQPGTYGNAIRGPLGIHRASMERYWFEAAGATFEAQFELLRQVRRVTQKHLEALAAGMDPIPDRVPPKPWVQLPAAEGHKQGFQILCHVPNAKRSGRNYVARCPACAQRGEDRRGAHLAISVAEPRMYHCWAGCTKEEIREALGQPIRRKQAA